MSFGFSVGDIISVGQLALQLYNCLAGNIDEECRTLGASLMSLQRSIKIASEVFSRKSDEDGTLFDTTIRDGVLDELHILKKILNTYLSAYNKYFESANVEKNVRKTKDKWRIIKWGLSHEGVAREIVGSTLLFHITTFQSYIMEVIFQAVFQTDKHVQEGVEKVKDVKDSVVRGFEGVGSEFKTMKERLDKADSRFSELSKEVATAVSERTPTLLNLPVVNIELERLYLSLFEA
ncbi:uncharacterized protein LAJ45_02240 [Morchella importuna]|uniref:uncharacterized protein n=1 Tax=Morchella importuna TaxID=1174673 RepID=UPI001E8DEFBB|nr:uncharacterized protein LAJ45_02240 [Morchella importuna]KAH8153428.1 hypothetical protein LAJ45_02240 [Morchella importuna]